MAWGLGNAAGTGHRAWKTGQGTCRSAQVGWEAEAHLPALHLHAVLELEHEGRSLDGGPRAQSRQWGEHPRHRQDLQLQRQPLQ